MSSNGGSTVVGAQLWVEHALSVQEENMKDGTEKKQQLVDEQISVEPRLPRRSFLTKTGAMLLGAAAVVSATRAGALAGLQQAGTEPKKETDPDAKKETDPDSKKETPKKTTTTAKAKASDPDSADKNAKKKTTAAKDKKKTSGESDPDKPKQPPY